VPALAQTEPLALEKFEELPLQFELPKRPRAPADEILESWVGDGPDSAILDPKPIGHSEPWRSPPISFPDLLDDKAAVAQRRGRHSRLSSFQRLLRGQAFQRGGRLPAGQFHYWIGTPAEDVDGDS
jgi:hypothetical protein